MPDQKHQETKQNSKEDQLKSEHEVKARQKNETDKQTQLKEELEQKKEKKRKLELTQEMEKKHEKDLKEAEEQDRIKKEEAIKSERQMCPLCGKEYRPIRICTCSVSGGGSGSGGGSDGGSGETEEKLNNDSNTPATFVGKLFEMAGQFGAAIKHAMDGSSLDQKSYQLSRMMFNSEVISDLLSKRILLIENNSDSGILTIRLLLSSSTLSDVQRKELKEFIKSILTELNAFKKENGILADCVQRDNGSEGNLIISFPTKPKMYDKFIQLLAEKQLLPMQVINQQENKQPVYQEGINHFNLTPFSTKLTYATRKNANLIDEEIKKEKALSIRPRTPSDGPKPK